MPTITTKLKTVGGSGSGTVTSVALTVPNIFSVSGSPITTSGTLAVSVANQSANRVWAGPATGADAAPTFRALVAADIPDLSSVYAAASHNHDSRYYTETEIDNLLDDKADLVGGVIPTAQIPAIAITEYLGEAADQVEMLLLSGQKGDWCKRNDTGTVWIITGSDPSLIANWTELEYPASPVTSVNGQTGTVVLGHGDVGAAAASHTHAIADVTSLQTALDGKQASNPAMTDNAIVRADGTAGAVQGSLIIVNDTGDITGVASITVNGIVSSRSQYWLDNANDHRLVVDVDENLSAHRNLNVRVNDANRTLIIAGDATISGTSSGTNTGDQTIVHTIQTEFDGGGSALADDDASKVLRSHFAGTMTSWILVTEGNTGDVEIDIWKAGAGDTPVLLDSICGTAYPTGDGQATGTVTGFTDTALAIGDTLIFNLRAASGATFVRFTLLVEE